MRRAVFLDRDGVLIEDTGLLCSASKIRVYPGVPEALRRLHDAGFRLIVVSNQAVVARGLVSEVEVAALQGAIEARLAEVGAPPLDGFYFCPHHPHATLEAYRVDCACRKPRAGLLLRASCEQEVEPAGSFLVGDRVTDVLAGRRAGCRTVLVQTSQHVAPPIETIERLDVTLKPDHVCGDLPAAANWILAEAA